MKITIILALICLCCSLISDQLSSFFDAHWAIAEFSFSDPMYLGMTVLWSGIIIWLSYDLMVRKRNISKDILWVSMISIFFLASEIPSEKLDLSVLISFQGLELVFFALAFGLLKTRSAKAYFLTDKDIEIDDKHHNHI